jgi:hypothetical protein
MKIVKEVELFKYKELWGHKFEMYPQIHYRL